MMKETVTRRKREKLERMNNREQMGHSESFNIEEAVYLFRLIQSALMKVPAEDKPASLSWDALYQLSTRGAVAGISYYGIEQLKMKLPKDVDDKWRRERDWIIYKQICFEAEREEIIRTLMEKGISCLPFKGVRLLNDYPEAGMRDMVDNDILYGTAPCTSKEDRTIQVQGGNWKAQRKVFPREKEIVRAVMCERGYLEEKPACDYHEEYLKKPFFNFEMHQRLAGPGIAYNYYEDSWRFAIQDPKHLHLFSMRNEDEYIQLFAHEYGHFMRCDSKLRFLVDIHVFLESKSKQMDWDYVRGELKKLGLVEFERKLRELSETLFLKRGLSPDQKELLSFLIEKANNENSEENRIKGKTLLLSSRGNNKLRYIWNRICIPESECRAYYPLVYRHRWLMPLLVLYRLGKGLILERRKFLIELRSLWKM